MSLQRLRLPRTPKPSVWLRACYWWYFSAVGCFIPYITLYYHELGLTGLQVGVLSAALPFGTALLAPLWGALADTFAAHRMLLRAAPVLAGVTAIVASQQTHFVPILLLMLLLAMFAAAIPALIDTYAVTISEREGQSYGQLRVWGTIGFIVAVWIVGWLMGGTVSNLFLMAYAAGLLLTGLVTLGLPSLQPRSAQPFWRGFAAIMRDRTILPLLLTTYLVSSNAGILFNFLGIYLVERGGSTQVVGAASGIAAISELPVLLFGSKLVDRFGSRRVLLLAISVYLVRLLLLALPITPTTALVVQLLHGPSFGAFLIGSVTLVHELVGRERAATAQGLLASMSFGFGSITGSLVGGALLEQIGTVGLFRLASVGMMIALVTCLLATRAIGAKQIASMTQTHGEPNPSPTEA